MDRSILVIVAHADDEALGCGATIAKHVAEGDVVNLLCLTDGVSAREGSDSEAVVARKEMQNNAQRILGINQIFCSSFPDNQLDCVPLLQVVKFIEQVLNQTRAEVIYTHFHGDLNIDHRVAHDAVMTACRPLPDSTVREIYGFEVLSSTEWQINPNSSFVPQKYNDIEQHYQTKYEALVAYQGEMMPDPHSRSFQHVETLAKHRGMTAGLNMAETFVIYRIIS